MDLGALEYFHIVAQSGSISRAAAALGMEPSTLTRHIGRLEDEAGVKLFHRSGRGMVTTQAGALLLMEARKVVDALQHTRRVAADLAAEGPAQIVVAAMPTIAQVTFGALGHALKARFPRARLRLVEGMGHQLVDWLQEGKIDVALLYVPTQSRIVDHDLLLQEPLCCVLPPGWRRPADPLPIDQLLNLPLVLPTTPHGLRGLAEMWAQRRGQRLQVAMECDGSTFMTRRLVAAGHGCTLLPLAAVQDEVERGQLQAVRLAGDEALRNVAIATASNRPAASGLWDTTQVLRQVVAALVKSGQWPGVALPRG